MLSAGGVSWRRHLPLNAVQARSQTHGKGQIRIAGGVGAAQFHPGGLAPGGGNTDQRGAVSGGPSQMTGGLVAGNQPLVAVYQRIGDGTESLHMVQKTRDELVGQRRQLSGIVLVIKGVFAVPEQRHVHMHAAAGCAIDGLGHKRGMEAVLLSQRLDGQLEGHDIVGGMKCLLILEINLMLCRSNLMM